MPASINRKILIRAHIPRPHGTFTRAGLQRGKASKVRQVSSRHKQEGSLPHDQKVFPRQARDILVACCKRKEGSGVWSIARELVRPYSTIRGRLVRMVRRSLGGRFGRKSTGRKKILNLQVLKKIMGWTRRGPSGYGFGPASWRLDMVNEMIRREAGRRARPRTLRRILRRLGLSYSKPRPVPRKTVPAEGQDMFKERVKRTILGVSGHGYAVLAVDEAGVMRGTSTGYGWRQAKSRDGVRTGFSTKAVRLFGALMSSSRVGVVARLPQI